jgi:putative exporter of polyketide antibiotics
VSEARAEVLGRIRAALEGTGSVPIPRDYRGAGAATGGDVVDPFIGVFVIALYGVAVAGIGLALGGVVRPSLAAPTVIVVVVGMLLIDILAPVLGLPDWVTNLSLAGQYGEPMIGNWDPVGIVASLTLAAGGLLIGALGFSRRDLRG